MNLLDTEQLLYPVYCLLLNEMSFDAIKKFMNLMFFFPKTNRWSTTLLRGGILFHLFYLVQLKICFAHEKQVY